MITNLILVITLFQILFGVKEYRDRPRYSKFKWVSFIYRCFYLTGRYRPFHEGPISCVSSTTKKKGPDSSDLHEGQFTAFKVK